MLRIVLTLLLTLSLATPAFALTQTERDTLIQSLLQQIAILQTQINTILAERGLSTQASPTPTTASSLTLTRNLYLGVRGDDVANLQNFLTTTGDFTYGEVTAYYGPATAQAVERYQCRELNLCQGTPDQNGYGSVGPKTRSALATRQVKITTPLTSITTTPPTLVPTTTPTIVPIQQSSSAAVPAPTTPAPITSPTTEVPVENYSCTFGGSTLANGDSVVAYQEDTASYGSTCISETRTCTNSFLSGSYQYAACAVGTPAPSPVSIQSRLIISGIPETLLDGDRASNLLWGRHSPKYVRSNGFRYAVLEEHPAHPRDVSVYRFNEANPDAGWSLMWRKDANDSHQPPSLLVGPSGELNIIHPVDSSTAGHGGEVVHIIIDNPTASTITTRVIDTSIWEKQNYYFGVAMEPRSGTIYLCSNNWGIDVLRCGSYVQGTWNVVNNVMSYAGHRYLYPNILPLTDHSFWLGTDAHKNDTPTGERTISFAGKITLQNGELRKEIGSGWALANFNASGNAYFENDIISNGTDGAFLLSGGTVNSADKNTYFFELSTGSIKKHLVPGLAGSVYNLYIGGNGVIHVLGGGKHFTSTDRGTTWSSGTYEIPGYPASRYSYLHAHTLKERSGATLKPGSILFLQELKDRQTNTSLVLEVEMSDGALAQVTPASQLALSGSVAQVLQNLEHQLRNISAWIQGRLLGM